MRMCSIAQRQPYRPELVWTGEGAHGARIFENREHIVRMLGLDRSVIESMPTAAAAASAADDDPLLCAECEG